MTFVLNRNGWEIFITRSSITAFRCVKDDVAYAGKSPLKGLSFITDFTGYMWSNSSDIGPHLTDDKLYLTLPIPYSSQKEEVVLEKEEAPEIQQLRAQISKLESHQSQDYLYLMFGEKGYFFDDSSVTNENNKKLFYTMLEDFWGVRNTSLAKNALEEKIFFDGEANYNLMYEIASSVESGLNALYEAKYKSHPQSTVANCYFHPKKFIPQIGTFDISDYDEQYSFAIGEWNPDHDKYTVYVHPYKKLLGIFGKEALPVLRIAIPTKDIVFERICHTGEMSKEKVKFYNKHGYDKCIVSVAHGSSTYLILPQ